MPLYNAFWGVLADSVTNQDFSWLQNASFKPDNAVAVHLEHKLSSSDSRHEQVARRKRSAQDKKQHAVKKQHVSKTKEQAHRAAAAAGRAASRTIWIDEAGLAPEAAHRIDRKSDPNNTQYDTLYSGDVARYSRKFGTHCLGLRQNQSIMWTDNRSKPRLARGKNSSARYFDKAFHLEPISTVLLSAKQPGDKPPPVLEDNGSCLLIDMATQADTKPAVTPLSPEEYISQQTAAYNRSLAEHPHDVQLWLQFIGFQDEALVWGKLPVFTQEGSASELRKRNQQALLERKIAIFESALERNPTSVQLLVGHMELCGEVWEEEKLSKRWKDLVFKHPNSPELWLAYIQFCQSRFSSFTVNSVTALYSKCISTLHAIQEGTLKSHKPHPHTPHSLLSIFYLYCSLMHQVGHSERAMACFQALIEYNLCTPPELGQEGVSHKDRLEFFETFWDSEVPRFGEAGAPGWNNWMESTQGRKPLSKLGLVESAVYSKAVSTAAEEGEDPELVLIRGLPLEEAWLKLEDYREREEALPWRDHGKADNDCTDPDHMVLFDDVSPFLFYLSDPLLRLSLVTSFLHFLGAPVPCLAMTDCAHRYSSMCLQWPWEVYHGPWRVTIDTMTYCNPSCSSYWQLGVGGGYRLMGEGKMASLVERRYITSEHKSQVLQEFISNAFNQSLSLFTSPQDQTILVQLWVEFELLIISEAVGHTPMGESGLPKEAKQKMKTVQRLIKRILKLEVHRNNLYLWNCCATLEHALGNTQEARKLYISILSQMSVDLMDSGVAAVLVGCVECLLGLTPGSTHTADASAALHVLVSAAEGKLQQDSLSQPMSPAKVLKAHNAYDQAFCRGLEVANLDTANFPRVCDVAMCYAVLECIGRSIGAAQVVLDTVTAALTAKLNTAKREDSRCCSGSAAQLQTLLAKVCRFHTSLVMWYGSDHPICMADLRRTIEKGLEVCPCDTVLLQYFIKSEQQSFVSGRLRRYFDRHAPREKTPFLWLYAIDAEMWRHQKLLKLAQPLASLEGSGDCVDEPETGVVHRIRGLFVRATQDSGGRHCPLLWRLYMKFEMEHNNIAQAKAAFYQGIHHCPWSKALCYDAAFYFPNEASKFIEIMEEKNLRMRAPLEEVKLCLDAMATAGTGSKGSD